jgi:hypothetical protein
LQLGAIAGNEIVVPVAVEISADPGISTAQDGVLGLRKRFARLVRQAKSHRKAADRSDREVVEAVTVEVAQVDSCGIVLDRETAQEAVRDRLYLTVVRNAVLVAVDGEATRDLFGVVAKTGVAVRRGRRRGGEQEQNATRRFERVHGPYLKNTFG